MTLESGLMFQSKKLLPLLWERCCSWCLASCCLKRATTNNKQIVLCTSQQVLEERTEELKQKKKKKNLFRGGRAYTLQGSGGGAGLLFASREEFSLELCPKQTNTTKSLRPMGCLFPLMETSTVTHSRQNPPTKIRKIPPHWPVQQKKIKND